jgi:methionyl-tRNA formyltransferase
MKVTLLTSNQNRHIFLINAISKIAKELNVIQECTTRYTGTREGIYRKSKIISGYFKKVKKAEEKIFPESSISVDNKCNLNLISIQHGDINYLKIEKLKKFFSSDIYIVFGTSFIKGKLCKYLISKKAINIHMGIAPYYKGTSCNFWALIDKNPNLVGATIHLLNKKIDDGKILYHVITNFNKDLFLYSMLTVKSAILSIKKKIQENKIFTIKPTHSNQKILRYSFKKDFSSTAIKKFYKVKINKKDLTKKYSLIKPFKL